MALLAREADLFSPFKDEILNPEIMADLSLLKELAGLKQEKDFLRLGALSTINDMTSNPVIQKNFPA